MQWDAMTLFLSMRLCSFVGWYQTNWTPLDLAFVLVIYIDRSSKDQWQKPKTISRYVRLQASFMIVQPAEAYTYLVGSMVFLALGTGMAKGSALTR